MVVRELLDTLADHSPDGENTFVEDARSMLVSEHGLLQEGTARVLIDHLFV